MQRPIYATKFSILKLLLERNDDLDIDTPASREYLVKMALYSHNPPLMMASIGGHSDIVRLLLERGADINIQNKYGYTAYDKTRYRDIKNNPRTYGFKNAKTTSIYEIFLR